MNTAVMDVLKSHNQSIQPELINLLHHHLLHLLLLLLLHHHQEYEEEEEEQQQQIANHLFCSADLGRSNRNGHMWQICC